MGPAIRLAVGTPFNGKQIDLSAVLKAAEQIGFVLREKGTFHVVVVKSTVVPGTTDQHVLPVLERASGKRAGLDFGVGMNPEFLSEGEAVRDFMNPDRIVLGGADERTLDTLDALYAPFAGCPVFRVNTRTAEMIKYTSNALLAALISFSNEIGNLGAKIGGIDVEEVMKGVHSSQYFRTLNGHQMPPITSFLRAGCGFGGSCLPKDVSALIAHGNSVDAPMPLLAAVLETNRAQPEKIRELLQKHWPNLSGVRISILGLAFKPGTSDARESPAFPIIRDLLEGGASIKAHDPAAMEEARKVIDGTRIQYCETLKDALSDVDAVVIVTPWSEFQGVPAALQKHTPGVVLVDARRAYQKNCVPKYEGIGL